MDEVTVSPVTLDEYGNWWKNFNYNWEDVETEWTLSEVSIATQSVSVVSIGTISLSEVTVPTMSMSEVTAPSVP